MSTLTYEDLMKAQAKMVKIPPSPDVIFATPLEYAEIKYHYGFSADLDGIAQLSGINIKEYLNYSEVTEWAMWFEYVNKRKPYIILLNSENTIEI